MVKSEEEKKIDFELRRALLTCLDDEKIATGGIDLSAIIENS